MKVGLVLLALVPALMGTAWAAKLPSHKPVAACIGGAQSADKAGDSRDQYVHLTMKRVAQRSDSDPSGIWTRWDIWNPYSPEKTDVWQGSYPTCDGGVIIVSQIMNRQCTSQTACPTRVIMRDAKGGTPDKTLIGYKQGCTLYDTYMLRRDGGQLMACNQPYDW